jgi:aspartate aminotransferase
MKISDRVAAMPPSATMAMAARAKAMKAAGKDILSFAVGEPDFPTPANICAAAKAAIDAGKTKYTPASGVPELKKAIVEAQLRDTGLAYEPTQVCVSNGGKHALMNIWRTLVNPGDEIIIFAPYWVSYPDQIRLCDGNPIVIPTSGDNDFQPDLDQVKAAVTDRTVGILVNSPSNPTGGVFSEETIRGIAEIAVESDLTIISDEIYKHLLYDGRKHLSPAMLGEEVKERTIIADGVAKTYAMTGWRIGWLIAPPAFAKAAGDLQSQETSNPSSISQAAAVEALLGQQESVGEMGRAFAERRDYLVQALRAIEGVKCAMPGGAFYVFPDVSAHFGRTIKGREIRGSLDMANFLLEEALVSLVDGASFGAEGYIRISFACSMEDIQEGVRRIKRALA